MNFKKLIFRGHAVEQMFKREISISDVKLALENGQIIREYPDDIPFPSFLVLYIVNGRPIHVVASTEKDSNCYIITTYVPDEKLWNNNFTKKIITMECVICKNGNTFPGHVTVTLERGNSIIAIKNVASEICENCGEYYLDDEMASVLLMKAEESFKKGVEIEVLNMNNVA